MDVSCAKRSPVPESAGPGPSKPCRFEPAACVPFIELRFLAAPALLQAPAGSCAIARRAARGWPPPWRRALVRVRQCVVRKQSNGFAVATEFLTGAVPAPPPARRRPVAPGAGARAQRRARETACLSSAGRDA